MDIKADPNRIEHADTTGVYVRALNYKGDWANVDLAELDRASLLAFLRSKSQDWCIDVVGILLDHGHLSPARTGEVDGG